ncbi:hypothetical protein P152DRAFT_424484 [Eremomyces bilateralis CBS 781.70]|uniref:DUF1772-domain-containing protein n=1 Tax=Eremomyces bilateralis CBS 781.70 TaxID=1392243 RepID=A0A6G1FSD9_9PEZI|nr:uncharacterized protein P152DRAFT_424484 [Eremomyces bilateralis CBS 781.70]KAF1808601.1 hypothetical protein P152DRAFT_424484 [Eremomyces bilateralis CBS 781.70]
MTSFPSVNLRTALLVAPLISTSCSLWFAADQHFFLQIFTRPECRERSNVLLPDYFRAFFSAGLPRVVGLLGITTWASVGSIWQARPLLESHGSLKWYMATAALAVGHLVFVPAVAPRIQGIAEGGFERGHGGGQKSNVDLLREWLRINMVRTLTTDLGAWLCCLMAVSKTLG